MNIQFGSPLTWCHLFGAFSFSCLVFAIGCFNLHLQYLLGESEKSIVLWHRLNVTQSSTLFYCELSYDDCLCPILSNKSNTSEKCITNVQLVGSRILPLVSFFLQIYLVRELFSLSTDHRHVMIYALWIACILAFAGMTISIYWSSCYHAYITLTLCWTGGSLLSLSLHNLLDNAERIPSSSHSNKIATVHRSKRNHNASVAWEELP